MYIVRDIDIESNQIRNNQIISRQKKQHMLIWRRAQWYTHTYTHKWKWSNLIALNDYEIGLVVVSKSGQNKRKQAIRKNTCVSKCVDELQNNYAHATS